MNLYAKKYKGYNIQEKLYYYRINRNEKRKHRPMKYRVDEMVVRFRGFKNMKILVKGMSLEIMVIGARRWVNLQMITFVRRSTMEISQEL